MKFKELLERKIGEIKSKIGASRLTVHVYSGKFSDHFNLFLKMVN